MLHILSIVSQNTQKYKQNLNFKKIESRLTKILQTTNLKETLCFVH
ncbi:hypothetical protein HCCG_00568 [Helicobacter cinaedi CCUG 18818 = ATCC BAA-847]|uniref:Uncharacterized protein n=1 Tax=Helicobacter cinaedi CCUG 18818 = ATCC BAA-847 TaxID=537971 RepID=A0ABN0B984_9HELI|nr:hypothetical protein HCCG_00568 [Helicobacter cinaedi CCUG 18818 = ATCC BAA-847]